MTIIKDIEEAAVVAVLITDTGARVDVRESDGSVVALVIEGRGIFRCSHCIEMPWIKF